MDKISHLAELQKKYMDETMFNDQRLSVHETWFDDSTTDYWRHKRMYETIAPLANHFRGASWLTVGDGRYGLDAIRLKNIFSLSAVFPTDIGENMLRISKERGFIEEYGVENAERLSFADNSFDIVFCKEAFHHFPRPYLALYEMIRVCKHAVVMIEPAERLIADGVKSKLYLASALRLFLSKLSKRVFQPYVPLVTNVNHAHEEAGNYLYAVSIRELEKLVHGLGMAAFAYKGFNDAYEKNCEFEKAQAGSPIFERISTSIIKADDLCRRYPQFHQPNMVSVILFKEHPGERLVSSLRQTGYQLPEIQKNPYI